MSFGQKLKELRTQAGMTQSRLAGVSGVPLGTIRDYEQGKRDPLLSTAQKLARALKQSLDVFAGRPRTRTARSRSRRATRGRKASRTTV